MRPSSLLLVFVFVFLPLSVFPAGCGGSGRADGDTETDGDTVVDGDSSADGDSDGDPVDGDAESQDGDSDTIVHYCADKPEAVSCDDGNPATKNDICIGGRCEGEPDCVGQPCHQYMRTCCSDSYCSLGNSGSGVCRPYRALGNDGQDVVDLDVSRDGRLVAAHDGQNIDVWRVEDGARVRRICNTQLNNQRAFAISPDGSRMAIFGEVTNDAGTSRVAALAIHDLLSGAPICTVRNGQDDGRVEDHGQELAWSPDGRVVAVGVLRSTTRSSESAILLYDPVACTSLSSPFPKHGGWVQALSFDPDGRRLAAAYRDAFYGTPGSMDVFEFPSGGRVHRQNGASQAVRFSPDGLMLAFEAGRVSVLRTDTWSLISDVTPDAGFLHVAFSPDSTSLLAVGSDQKGYVFETRQWNERYHIPGIIRGTVGEWLESGLGFVIVNDARDVTNIEVRSGTDGRLTRYLKGIPGRLRSAAFLADSSRLLASDDTGIRVWDLASGSVEKTLPASGATNLAVSPDGRFAAWNLSGITRVVEAGAWETVREFSKAYPLLSFCPDGSSILTGTGSEVTWYDLPSGTLRANRTNAVATDLIIGLYCSAQTPLFVRQEGDRLKVLDVRDEREVFSTGMPGKPNYDGCTWKSAGDASFSADGSQLAWNEYYDCYDESSWRESTLRVVGLPDGREILPPLSAPVYECVRQSSLSPDGRFLFVVGVMPMDHRKRLASWSDMPLGWGCSGRAGLLTLDGRSCERAMSIGGFSEATADGFSPDGRWAFAAMDDGSLHVWDVADVTLGEGDGDTPDGDGEAEVDYDIDEQEGGDVADREADNEQATYCEDDAACPLDEYCRLTDVGDGPLLGECEPGCRLYPERPLYPDSCAQSLWCTPLDRQCEPGCKNDHFCLTGEICDPATHRCLGGVDGDSTDGEQEDESDTSCPDGDICHWSGSICSDNRVIPCQTVVDENGCLFESFDESQAIDCGGLVCEMVESGQSDPVFEARCISDGDAEAETDE